MYRGISEIYPCIQGEGARAGIPSILVRTLGCNLRCAWCDTPYTSWKPEAGKYRDEDLLPFIEKFPEINDVIISGGEPAIYPGIEALISLCKANRKIVTVETNGTRLLPVPAMRMVDLVSLSPKLTNSSPAGTPWEERHNSDRLHPGILRSWIAEAKDYQVKFVVKSPEDVEEITRLVAVLDIPKTKVFLMPEGATREQLREKRIWLAGLCLSKGYRYCERIHIVIYGDKRGV